MRTLMACLVVCSCSVAPDPAPAPQPVPVRPPPGICTPARGLLFAGLQPTTELAVTEHRAPGLAMDQLGALAIDGVVTGSQWPMRPPAVYPLPDGRSLLYDGYNANLVSVWDPQRRTLTELGRGALLAVPGHGWLLLRSSAGDRLGVYDVDPDATQPRARLLWEATPNVHVGVAGTLDGAIALAIHDGTPQRIACITAPGVTTTVPVAVPAGWSIAGGDAIRDRRLLLVAQTRPHLESFPPSSETFPVDVAVLDLVTGKLRRIGKAVGGWSVDTAIPHPRVTVQWRARHAPPRDRFELGGHAINVVDPDSERVN